MPRSTCPSGCGWDIAAPANLTQAVVMTEAVLAEGRSQRAFDVEGMPLLWIAPKTPPTPLLNLSNEDAAQVASILKTHTRDCKNGADTLCCVAAERVRLGLLEKLRDQGVVL